ncbi:hypothetical protein D3C75_365930 [compost metagenome]
MHVITVAHNQQAVGINIADHCIYLHRTDYIFMQMLIQPVSSAEHMPLYNIYNIREGKLIGNVPRFLFNPDSADPLLRNHNAEVLSLLHRPVSRPLTHYHFLRQLAYRNFGAYLETFDMLQQLFMLCNVIALSFQLLHPHTPICTILYSLYSRNLQSTTARRRPNKVTP